MNTTARSPFRLAAVLTLALGALLAGGCASTGLSLQRDLPAILTEVPAPQIVAKGKELVAADAAAAAAKAAGLPGVQTFWGVGASMEPLFSTHTAIVVTPVAYASLRKGMMVLYRNDAGVGIAHVLVARQHDGWTAQGVNRDEVDDSLVTDINLVGVVTQAIAASAPAGRQALVASLLPAHLALPRTSALTGLVAFQAPAR